MSAYDIWLWFVLIPGLDEFFICLGLTGAMITTGGTLFTFLCWADNEKETSIRLLKYLAAPALLITVVALMLNIVLPDEKQVIAMFGAEYLSNVEGMSELPEDVVAKLREVLELKED